jgi:transcriptional regulator GlxA family with amidase domain
MTLHVVEAEFRHRVLPFSLQSDIAHAGDGGAKVPVLERLIRSLLSPDEAGQVLRGYYTDAFHAKLLQHLDQIRHQTADADGPREKLPLPEWRFKRVVAFVDDNIDQPLSLPCLARAAGLSRMHFAAVFRRATGLRPHEFVTKRRIARARQWLSGSHMPIVDIALSVGFQSQAHFTTVFKRAVGTTPHRWRLEHAQHKLPA